MQGRIRCDVERRPLARAYTGRDLIALCADQPFFSVDDWFIGTTAMKAGVPDAVKQLSVLFPYGDLAAAAHRAIWPKPRSEPGGLEPQQQA